MAFVMVTNESDDACAIDTKLDISVQITSPRRVILLPLETEQYARLLERQNRHNKELAKQIRKKPWKLGPQTISGKSTWGEGFYFASDPLDEPFVKQVNLQVMFEGYAFVFPFEI